MASQARPSKLPVLWALFRVIPEPEREPGPHRRGGNGGFYALIGLLLGTILLGRWVGPLVLLVLLAAAGGIVLLTRRK